MMLTPLINTWRGKPIEDHTKEELIEIASLLGRQLEEAHKNVSRMAEVRINPPIMLTEDARSEVDACLKQFKNIFGRLYWRQK